MPPRPLPPAHQADLDMIEAARRQSAARFARPPQDDSRSKASFARALKKKAARAKAANKLRRAEKKLADIMRRIGKGPGAMQSAEGVSYMGGQPGFGMATDRQFPPRVAANRPLVPQQQPFQPAPRAASNVPIQQGLPQYQAGMPPQPQMGLRPPPQQQMPQRAPQPQIPGGGYSIPVPWQR